MLKIPRSLLVREALCAEEEGHPTDHWLTFLSI
jgi:hypothetical protein